MQITYRLKDYCADLVGDYLTENKPKQEIVDRLLLLYRDYGCTPMIKRKVGDGSVRYAMELHSGVRDGVLVLDKIALGDRRGYKLLTITYKKGE